MSNRLTEVHVLNLKLSSYVQQCTWYFKICGCTCMLFCLLGTNRVSGKAVINLA